MSLPKYKKHYDFAKICTHSEEQNYNIMKLFLDDFNDNRWLDNYDYVCWMTQYALV